MMNKLIDLLNIYNRPGVRYTYYPFHSKWNDSLSSDDQLSYIKNQIPTDNKIDLYIHIPFCHSLCSFCGCNVKVMKSNCDNEIYLKTLKTEWSFYPKGLVVDTLYIGGGTPNFYSPSELSQLISHFTFTDNKIITIEIDPRFITKSDLDEYKKMGITRLSIGIQDFDPKVLSNVNREQNTSEIIDLVNYAAGLNFENINLDFIYGLSFQTPENFAKSLELIKTISAQSISLYPFAKVPWQNNFQAAFSEIKDFTILEMNTFFANAAHTLSDLGFEYIGMGYFTKEKTKFRRNIMGFTPRKNNIQIGLGVSAISTSPIGHIQNEKIYAKYIHKIKDLNFSYLKTHKKNTEENERETFFENVICQNFISESDFNHLKTEKITNELVEKLLKDGLLEKVKNGFMIGLNFRFFHKTILQFFDPFFTDQ